MTLSSTGQPSTIAVAALALSLERLREPVRQGTTAPLAWRLQQLEGMAELLNSHEQAVLDALAADLGKPPVEAYFELVAVRQELKLAPTAAAALDGGPATCRCRSPNAPGRGPS